MQHIWTLVVLVTVIVFGGWIGGEVGLQWLSHPWMVAVGVMVLVAYAAGEALRNLGLPALLGWIGVGILLGPSLGALLPIEYPFALITDEVIEALALVQVLIVGVIGMLAGAKLRIADLAGQVRLPLQLTGAFLLVVVPLTMAAVLVVGQLFPNQLAFLVDQPASTQITIALFFGVLAFGLAPSVTLALLQDLRSRGPMSTVVLGTVVVAEFALFVLFALVLSVGRSVAAYDVFSATALLEALPAVVVELGISMALGGVLAIVVAIYLRYVRREPLIFVLVALVVGYFGVAAVDAEPLLTFLVAGLFVQNATEQGDLLAKVLERIALPVFVIYFATLAAGIDLAGTLSYLPLVFALVVARCVGLYWGARWASRKAVRENHLYEYLRTSFFSQDAVVLVLAGVVAHPAEPFGWGAQFQSVIVATVVAYLVVGPILLKLALDRSGETRKARRSLQGGDDGEELGKRSLKWLQQMTEGTELARRLDEPDFDDAWLRGHVGDLREELLARGSRLFCGPPREQLQGICTELEDVRSVVEVQTEGLHELVEKIRTGAETEQVMEQARGLQKNYARQMIPVVERIEAISGVAISSQQLEEFFRTLRTVQDQQSLYRIERETGLDESTPDDPVWLRVFKAVQRLRVRWMGPGLRTVPVGKLWRYHVELALPIELARRTPEVVVYNEKFWNRLWRHLQGIDVFWDELIEGITRSDEELQEEAQSLRQQGRSPEEVRAKRKERRIERFFEEFRQEQDELAVMAEKGARLLEFRFSEALVGCYTRFLDATARAGTIYLPRFRYRAAARFGQGRRAERRVVDRLRRQEAVVAGYRGWIRLDHEVATFEQWSNLFGNQIGDVVESALGGDWWQRLVDFAHTCHSRAGELGELKGEDADRQELEAIYDNELRPEIAAFRQEQEDLLGSLHRGEATRTILNQIEERLERLPRMVSVLSGTPEEMVLASVDQQYELPLHRWMALRVGHEMGLRIAEFNDRAGQRIERRLTLLSGVEQALEFNLVTAQKGESDLAGGQPPLEMARQGLTRAHQLVDAYLDGAVTDTDELTDWLSQELSDLVSAAVEPIEQRQIGAIERRLARLEGRSLVGRGENWLTGALEPVSKIRSQLRGRVADRSSDWMASIRQAVVEKVEEVDDVQIRKMLYADRPVCHPEVPPVYRRLFVPMPLDIPDFYRHRSDLEERILQTVQHFFDGRPHALLISGEAGGGKRTVVRHLIPGRIYAVEGRLTREQVASLSLATTERTEEAICTRICEELLDIARCHRFRDLSAALRRGDPKRRIIVVEQPERVFLRTEEGLDLARRFFELVSTTSEQVLWVIVMNRAAQKFLKTHLELGTYFTHHEQIGPLSAAELERLVLARHQVSGFDLEFEQPQMAVTHRLRQPLFGPAARQIARRVFFERLAIRSGQNPRTALLLWLQHLRCDPLDDSKIVVQPIASSNGELLAQATIGHKLLLASLSLHQTLSLQELSQILREPPEQLHRELEYLSRLGMVEILPEATDVYRLRPIASNRIEGELRAMNLL